MSEYLFTLNRPITLQSGTGVTLTESGNSITTREFIGDDEARIRVSIGQEVATSSNVQFGNVTLAPNTMTIGTGSNRVLVISDNSVAAAFNGDLHFDNDLLITEDLEVIGPFRYRGNLSSSTFSFDTSTVTQSLNTGSNTFGDNIDIDNQIFSQSMEITGSFELNNSNRMIEISNDNTVNDGAEGSLVTEYAAFNYLSGQNPARDYIRKSFTHTGSFQNSTTFHFYAITASAPIAFSATNEDDFMFFLNGMIIEPDALTIRQSGTTFILTIDDSELGYGFDSADEVIGFGKFNS